MTKISRIEFIKLTGLAFVAFQSGCITRTKTRSILSCSLEYLLPKNEQFPSFDILNTDGYIAFLQENAVFETYQLDRFSNAEKRLNEISNADFNALFISLSTKNRTQVCNTYLSERSGSIYFNFLQKLQLESMFADAYYGFGDPRIKEWLQLPTMSPGADDDSNFVSFG